MKYCDVFDSELDDINDLRVSVGLPPLYRKARKCMKCGEEIVSYSRHAWCNACKSQLTKDGYLGGSLDE